MIMYAIGHSLNVIHFCSQPVETTVQQWSCVMIVIITSKYSILSIWQAYYSLTDGKVPYLWVDVTLHIPVQPEAIEISQ